MNIHGLQKMTLLDFPGAVACTVFLGGCDFRCPYCHNAELLDPNFPPLMDETELLAFLKKRQGLLDGVCITGGEPLLRQELPTLLGEIRALGYKIKLDTNGAHPAQLRRILDAGLADYVAMDIKNSPERYAETIGRAQFDVTPIRESVRLLCGGGAPRGGRHPRHRTLDRRSKALFSPALHRPRNRSPGRSFRPHAGAAGPIPGHCP